jgi:hypothetical protein
MIYIYATENNIVNYIGEQKPINRTDEELLIVKEYPKYGYDYLTVENIREETGLIDNEIKTYKTCDLIPHYIES